MYNKAILIGRMTADPELRATPTGVNTCSFSLAVDRAMTRDKTDFLRIVAWRTTAEFICRYFTKGRPIGIEGEIQTRSYTDRDGVKHDLVEIVASRAFFVASKAEGSPTGSANQVQTQNPVQTTIQTSGIDDEEDLPF